MQNNQIVVKRSTVRTMLAVSVIVALLLVIGAASVLAKPEPVPQAACTEVCVEYSRPICNVFVKNLEPTDEFPRVFCPAICVKTEAVCPQTCETKVLELPEEEANGYLNEEGASMLPLAVFRVTCWGYHEATLADFGLAGRTDLKVLCRTEDGGWTDTTNAMTLLEGGEKFGGNVEQHGVCGFFPA